MSPVVGTVLLVAIVVALSALVAAVAFGTGGPREPAPDVVLELEQTDRPVAHELVVEGGDTLVGEKVEFRGTADEDPLAGRLRAGESLTVYPVEDTVRVVWFGEYTTTQILATFDPDPDLPPVDEGCNWVESTTGGHTNPVTVDVVDGPSRGYGGRDEALVAESFGLAGDGDGRGHDQGGRNEGRNRDRARDRSRDDG